MPEKDSGGERFPAMAPPPPQPWFELALQYLTVEQQRIIVARVLDIHIAQQEQMLEIARMARDMLKRERKIE
jgi:hypothetical protein